MRVLILAFTCIATLGCGGLAGRTIPTMFIGALNWVTGQVK
ncbi:MAG TPA: hypothetical protein VKJ45_26770 [Blastocatellia bacterium]|nr:hypothetical protein [Blastocatellia bacterium]